MAKKAKAFSGDRTDPKQNKSLAIRTGLKRMPAAKATEVAAEVKKQFGHTVGSNQIYMIKTKLNMRRRPKSVRRVAKADSTGKLTSATMWVEAIKIAKQLLSATGSVDNAISLLRAIGD
jgi:hypothetical protein